MKEKERLENQRGKEKQNREKVKGIVNDQKQDRQVELFLRNHLRGQMEKQKENDRLRLQMQEDWDSKLRRRKRKSTKTAVIMQDFTQKRTNKFQNVRNSLVSFFFLSSLTLLIVRFTASFSRIGTRRR